MIATRLRAAAAVVFTLLLAAAGPLAVQAAESLPAAAAAALLATQRWQEHAYGVSLLPPLDARLEPINTRGAVLRIVGHAGYTITVSFKSSPVELTIANVQAQSMQQLQFLNPSAVILEQREIAPAGRPGALLYFQIRNTKEDPWVMAQAFMQIDPSTFAMFQLEVDQRQLDATRPVFEAMLDSLRIVPPADLDKQRQAWIEAGGHWLESIEGQPASGALIAEQWHRILDEGRDVGWQRTRQVQATVMDVPGVQVEILARIQRGQDAQDTISHYFLSSDAAREIWSVRRVLRKVDPGSGLVIDDNRKLPEFAWIESGLRDGIRITVTRETPSSKKELYWERPDCYLSQAQLQLLGPLFKGAATLDLGAYSYFHDSSKIALTTLRTEPLKDGSFRVHVRPSPELAEIIHLFDRQGRLLKTSLPTGREIVQTSPEHLKRIWNVR